MNVLSTKPLAAFGFLTVLENAEHGLFGGYLVLSPQGRPLEFRCSTPVQPSRAQEILYGPTLRPYLLSEVIGLTLVDSSEVRVSAILTDMRDMLPLAALRSEEVLSVTAVAHGPEAADACHGDSVKVGRWQLTTYSAVMRTAEQLQALLEPITAHIDLCEPFERIRAALNEARLSSPNAAEDHDDFASAA